MASDNQEMTGLPVTENRKPVSPKRWIAGAAAGLAAALGLLAVLYAALNISVPELAALWKGADKTVLLATLLYSVVHHVFLGADKLYRVFRSMGLSPAYADVLRLRLGAGPFRALLPVDTGELVHALFFWRTRETSLDRAAGAVVFDRGLNLQGSTFWLVAGLLMLGSSSPAGWAAACLVAGGVYAAFFWAVPAQRLLIRAAGRLHTRLGRIAEGILSPFTASRASHKLLFLAYGIVFQARPLIVAWLLFAAFGVSVPAHVFVAFTSLAVFAGHVPTSAGMGPREAAFVLLFADYAPAPALFAVGLSLTLFVHVIPMACGAPWAWWLFERIRRKEE
ncbi:MAG: lysylphosphatidylglycerol synthase domain-containing protein [Desulfatibacillaceae bacterium]